MSDHTERIVNGLHRACALPGVVEKRRRRYDEPGQPRILSPPAFGEPKLTEQIIAPGFAQKEVLTLVASLERYSKHPLARAILAAAKADGPVCSGR